MSSPECPGDSLRNVLASDPRDWSLAKRDAWVYGIVLGWSEESLKVLAKRHDWPEEDVDRLRRLHDRFKQAFPDQESDHPFRGDGADCKLCGEGRRHYVHLMPCEDCDGRGCTLCGHTGEIER